MSREQKDTTEYNSKRHDNGNSNNSDRSDDTHLVDVVPEIRGRPVTPKV